MTTIKYCRTLIRGALRIAYLAIPLLLGACADTTDSSDTAPTGDFEIVSPVEDRVLVEGEESGIGIALSLTRRNGHNKPVSLSIEGVTTNDTAFLNSSFNPQTLLPGADTAQAVVSLAIADLPILPHQRRFYITASDGVDQDRILIELDIEPVDAPDVYLLIGQSNMVGYSGDGTRQAYAGGADEPNPRIKQLNVSSNSSETVFLTEEDFSSSDANIMTPNITVAEDPLHIPLDIFSNSGKDQEYIGLGLSFAKQALNFTSRDIILVPAAWAGSAFCANELGPNGQWNAQATTNPNLGNTWLFERAVTRANLALQASNGILRGILWHQGESDSNQNCAPLYAANLERLVYQLRLRIAADRRGGDLRRPDSNIPFVVGTMSRGADERGDLSIFAESKQIVDNAHRSLGTQVPSVAHSNHDDLVPANGYPCGNSSCVHFGADALREMGRRYHAALLRAAGSP